MNATLRVAAAQGESVPGEVSANVTTALSLVDAAASDGARAVVLPELFLTGYAVEVWTADHAITTDDSRLAPLGRAARDHGVVVVVGAAVRRQPGPSGRAAGRFEGFSGSPVTLSLLVFDSEGHVTAPYDKQHLFEDERGFFTRGDHGASIVVDGWELGLGICYDGCFPEHAAAASRAGAQAYLCPSAYYRGAEHRRDLYYAARALDNGIYVVFAGLTGRCGSHEFSGGSAVYDPEGRPVERVGAETTAVVVADLDPAEIARVRTMNPIARDRLGTLGPRTRHTVGAR